MTLTVFGIPIYEFDVFITDYILCLESLFFGIYAFKKFSRGIPRLSGWLFLALAASSCLGGTFHGLFPEKTATPGGLYLWLATLLSIGVAASVLWRISLTMWMGERHLFGRNLFNGTAFFLYTACLLFFRHTFHVAIFYYLPPLLLLFFLLARENLKAHAQHLLVGMWGIFLTLAAAFVQMSRIALHPTYFNHNALYHLIQGVALVMLFYSLTRITTSPNPLRS